MLPLNNWRLSLLQPRIKNCYTFLPLLYLSFIQGLGYYTQTSRSTIWWERLYFYESRQLAWMKRRSFRKENFHAHGNIRFQITSRTFTYPKRIRLDTRANTIWTLFLQTWALARPKSNMHYTVHRDFRLFFLSLARTSPNGALVSPKGYYNRWVNTYNFLFNLFFVNSFTQVLANKFFIEEALVFNWEYSYKNYKVFKYVQPFLIFSDMSHGESVHDVIARLLDNNLDFLLVVDLKTHNKLLKHLKSYHVFMVGLTPINYAPWGVSYPVPTFADSYVSQLFFLKFVMRLQMHARGKRYSTQLALRTSSPFY